MAEESTRLATTTYPKVCHEYLRDTVFDQRLLTRETVIWGGREPDRDEISKRIKARFSFLESQSRGLSFSIPFRRVALRSQRTLSPGIDFLRKLSLKPRQASRSRRGQVPASQVAASRIKSRRVTAPRPYS